MIDGYDYCLCGPTSQTDMEFILREIHGRWPKGTMYMESSGRWPLVNRPQPAMKTDTFVYRTPEDEATWDLVGYTLDNTDNVVLIFPESDCISFVVSDRDSPSGKIIQDIISGLQRHRAKRA